ncbi:protein-ER retention protein [Coemansia sp. RSA 485]|nr:protein-ER retention protein [Coemansia sp. RSA 485]
MFFPVAFQVLFLLLLVAFGWGANLRYLSLAGIEVRPILQLSELPTASHGESSSDTRVLDDGIHRSVFGLAAVLGGIALAGWTLCLVFSVSPAMQTCITLITYMVITAALVVPQRILFHTTRMQLLHSLFRIVKPSMTDPVYLCDIIMADILTSCARIFSDLLLVACKLSSLFWYSRQRDLGLGYDGGIAKYVDAQQSARLCTDPGVLGAVLVAMPYIFRLRQCTNEYLRSTAGSSDAKRHFANAVKYASSIPVICLSSAQKRAAVDGTLDTKYSDWVLRFVYGLWVLSVAFNSLYSYYWDIAFDWNLGHMSDGSKLSDLVAPTEPKSPSAKTLSASGSSDFSGCATETVNVCSLDADGPDHEPSRTPLCHGSDRAWSPGRFPLFLRPQLRFGAPHLYYAAMLVDFLLRITWTAKLTSYIYIDLMAYGGFWLNVLEIYRRWQWTFLRIEKEAAV